MKVNYGATFQEWMTFAERLKLRGDLLPVVSNPSAPIAPYSKMKDKGKTPSRYNSDRQVHGIPDWTNVTADARDISRWSKEPDYGICLQTRLVRGVDIDVADGPTADAIEDAVRASVPGVHFPKRWRSNSGKRLLAFSYDGELTKRSFPVGTERVELLATGQQFVACGLHPSGSPYQWDGGLPEGFPVLTTEEVEELWSTLELLFATGPSIVGKRSERERGSAAGEGAAGDDVAAYLSEMGLILDEGPGGQVYLECPWKAEHSSDSGVSETSYFPAGTGGFDCGHFKCLHDHCSGRTDEEFLDAIGFNSDIEFRSRDFPDLSASTELSVLPSVPTLGEAMRPASRAWALPARLPIVPADIAPIFKRDQRSTIIVTENNVAQAVGCAPFITRKLAYDSFTEDVVWAHWNEADNAEAWQPWMDVNNHELMRTLDVRGFKATPGIETVRRCVEGAARNKPIDLAIYWLNGQRWDGVERIEMFLVEYMGAEDTPYARAVARYMWSALAGRVLQPGVKADMAVIFKSGQGKAKTSAVEAMAPFDDWFGEIDLARGDADLARQMRQKVVCELAELKGLAGRDSDAIKSFISARFDEWVPKYKERAIKHLRRCLFFGTTNEDEILFDPTGERRWLPIEIGQGDVRRIRADRAQLWAEAAVRFEMFGVEYADAEELAREEHGKWKSQDPLQTEIEEWTNSESLGGGTPATEGFSFKEMLHGAFDLEVKSLSPAETKRYKRCLQALGYRQRDTSRGGVSCRVWMKTEK